MTTESQIASAVAEVILTGTAITPRTAVATTSGAAQAGHNYIDVVDASDFLMQGTCRFWDATADEELGIASVAANRITLEAPLLATHPAGTILSTNLLDYVPEELGQMVLLGKPCVFVAPLRSSLRRKAQGAVNGPLTLQIQVNLQDEQRGTTLHPNVWARQQQRRCEDLLHEIVVALLANPHLNTSTGTYAQGIGAEGDHVSDTAYGSFVTRDNVPVFAAATHVIVRPRHLVVPPPALQ